MKLILLPSAQEPGSTCRLPFRICGFELQLSSRQPEASGWIYRASRSPSLGSMLFGCQLYGRLLEILAQLLAPELWPSGSPDLLAPHWIICAESLIQNQGLWIPLSGPAWNLQCRISWIFCTRALHWPHKFSTPPCLHTPKIDFVYLYFSKWECWCGIAHLLTLCSADSDLPCWSFCQMETTKYTVTLRQNHELSNCHFSFSPVLDGRWLCCWLF